MNTKKVQKKRGKKRGTRLCAFFLRILFRCRHRHREETIIVVVTFFTSLAESPDDFDDENFGNAQERERETPSSRPQNENEKRVVFLFFSRTLTVRIEKKNVSTTVSSFLILQKLSFVASNARLRRKGVDKRSRFTAPPTVPTVLDESGSRREPFFVET